jgi:hypothetical protein
MVATQIKRWYRTQRQETREKDCPSVVRLMVLPVSRPTRGFLRPACRQWNCNLLVISVQFASSPPNSMSRIPCMHVPILPDYPKILPKTLSMPVALSPCARSTTSRWR